MRQHERKRLRMLRQVDESHLKRAEAAHRESGGGGRTKENCRDARTVSRIQDHIQEPRSAARMPRKLPSVTRVIVIAPAERPGFRRGVLRELIR